MLKFFRGVALIEGVTTLLLFLIAMPAKYWFGNAALVPPVGLIHGIAWIAYMIAMVIAFAWHRVPVMGWLRSALAGLVPFGTFINDPYVHRLDRSKAVS